MGRTPLTPETWQAVSSVNTGYSTLELDLDTGKRGCRNGLTPDLLNVLVGAEAALVVNNNAAAVTDS
jgi:L-seryl-tRNA(Ser) seleniumtransferase